MLTERRVHTTLPVSDLDRARTFYERVLGFEPFDVQPGAVLYRAGEGSVFAISRSTGAPSGTHTQMGFTVTGLGAEVADLKRRGIVFEEYDLPGFRTEGSIAQTGPNRAAWFRDSEGNLLGLIEFGT